MVRCMEQQSKNSLVKEGKHLGGTRGIAPVAHEIRSDSELRENVDPSITHAVVGLIGGLDVEGAAGVRVDEDSVASFTEGEGDEDDADLCGDLEILVNGLS